MQDDEPDVPVGAVEAGLIDLSGVPLSRLRVLDETVLAHSLRRVIDAATQEAHDSVAAFDSSV